MNRYITISLWLKRAFFALFAVSFGWMLYNIVFHGHHGRDPLLLAFLTPLCAAALFCANRCLARAAVSARAAARVLAAFVVLTAVIQLYLGFRLRYTPMWDMDAVFGGARDWALTGDFARYHEYYAMLPPNLGAMFLCRVLFSVAYLFGVQDFYPALVAYNVLLLSLAACALYDAARRLAGVSAALFALLLLAVFLPYYVTGAVLYTDVLSMPYGILAFDVYLIAKAEKRRQWALYAAAGALFAIGGAVKATVFIILVAVALEAALSLERGGVKRVLGGLGVTIAAAAALAALFYGYMGTKLDAELVRQQRMPFTHWVMMGLTGSGGYDPGEYEFSKGLPDLAARRREIPKVIASRVREQGVKGLFERFTRKAARDFGDGTFAQSDFLDDGPVNETGLHEVFLYAGKHYDAYATIATATLCAFYLLALAGAAAAVKQPGAVAPWLALFGLLLFLLWWEASSRYTQNFLPFMALAAALGAGRLSSLLHPAHKLED